MNKATITIENNLMFKTFDGDKLSLDVPSSEYSVEYSSRTEQIFIKPIDSTLELDEINTSDWTFVGKEDEPSFGSDISYFSIQDSKDNQSSVIDYEELWNVMDEFYSFGSFIVGSIPSGTNGCVFVYTKKDEQGNIIAILLTGDTPEDFLG